MTRARRPAILCEPALRLVPATTRVAGLGSAAAGSQPGGSDTVAEAARGRAQYAANRMSMWPNPGDADRQVAWTREFWSALEPLTTGGVFVNFLGDEGQDRVRAAYGPATYERLLALKNRYDPTNLFRLNQNIKPAV